MENENKDQADDLSIEREDFGSETESKIKKLKAELKECRKKSVEYLSGWQRAKADLINARKDEEKRNEAMAVYANERLLFDLLNVFDSFDRALSDGRVADPEKAGLSQINGQLAQIARGYGLQEIKALGQKFNPQEHEGVIQEDVSDPEKDQTVLEELQKGYKIHGKVLRPARVKIGSYKKTN